jgi:Ti-type conjugative transfer relaxase TraA
VRAGDAYPLDFRTVLRVRSVHYISHQHLYIKGRTALAIYHLTAKVISRARGQSITAAAAYRSGTVLRDERYGLTHNYTRDRKVEHSEIMSPPGAPAWVHERETLWNRVEAAERRKDSQLARALEISLPVELAHTESVDLVRDYIAQEFVSKGMIADFSIRRSDPNNPYAQILLTLREATPAGFGPKMRHWNRKSSLLEWREAWAERANQHLARAGHVMRIDHRTLEAQQSELLPSRKMGVGRARQGGHTLPEHMQERVAEQQRIAKENGAMIVEDPTVALRALSRLRPIFTQQELVDFLQSRTDDPAQLDAALAAVMGSSELMALAADSGEPPRFTSRDMLEAEKSLLKRVAAMATRRGHGVPAQPRTSELPPSSPTGLPHSFTERNHALAYLVSEGDIKAFAAPAGDGKNALLAAAREAWEVQGLDVRGVALSRSAVDTLQASSGIHSHTLAAQEQEWQEGRDPFMSNQVLVVDGAEMIGVKPLERILAVADKARGKVILVGDSQQLEAMGSLSPLRSILDKLDSPATAAV